MSKVRAVLDANVLYDDFVRDMLLSLFAAGLYEAKWTDKITQEWVIHLLANNPRTSKSKLDRTVGLMNRVTPAALVERYEQYIGQVIIPDKDDRHVVAAAIACGAQKVVTYNLRDFPNRVLAAFGVVAESPDKFFSDLIIDDTDRCVEVFRAMRLRLRVPPLTADQFLDAMKDKRLAQTAVLLAKYHDRL
jgi:predicted nucleic acid-binding protein